MLLLPLPPLLLVFLLPPTLATPPPGLLVVGGDATATSVELWSPTSSCSLAPLPQPAVAPSVDVVEGEVVACHGTSCSTLSGGVWGEGAVLRESRRWHTTATTARGLLLMGGFDSPNTTEVVAEGQAAVGFPLHPGTFLSRVGK